MCDRAAICTCGSGAVLNFPRDFYEGDDLPNSWVANEKQLLSILHRFKQPADNRSSRCTLGYAVRFMSVCNPTCG